MIEWSEYTDVWRKVKRAARTTINRDGEGVYPSDSWKKTILLAEHSPIRKIRFEWKWKNIKSWISVHFVRHKHGIEHWVTTQRTDRTGVNRDEAHQDTPVSHECEANAQALIIISRRRLCAKRQQRPARLGRRSRQRSRRSIPFSLRLWCPNVFIADSVPNSRAAATLIPRLIKRR